MPPKKLNEISGMPQIVDALNGWGSKITLMKVTQAVVNGFVQQVTQELTFIGTIQPLSPKLLQLKPEGQRGFQWLQIHCYEGDLQLNDNDQITYSGDLYKIMGVLPYDLNNYREYHAIKDYQGP